MKTEEQNDEFINKEQEEILQEEFNFDSDGQDCKKTKLTGIIDSFIDVIENNPCRNDIKDRIKKHWFTKQIEDWKENKKEEENEEKKDNNDNKELNNDELMDIVKKDLKIRIANTMLELKKELKKYEDIKYDDIWFYQNKNYVALRNKENDICKVLEFNALYGDVYPPYKPFFMKNSNDENKLNGVCIYKHGKKSEEYKKKWIMACFKNDDTKPKCKITFETDDSNKITHV